MQQLRLYFRDKFLRIEIAFFVCYYFFFGILSNIEFKLTEPPNPRHPATIEVAGNLIHGLITVIPVWILYKFIIQRNLFQKKYLSFFLLLILYFLLLNFYNLYSNLLLSKLAFLPDNVIKGARRAYRANVLFHFGGTVYMIREYMVLLFLAYFIKSSRQERQMNKLKQQQLQAELKYLKVQLQPHFFFNTLNNIYSLTLQQSAKAAPLVARHADMMRYILCSSDNAVVPLQQEVDFLQNYAEVETVRYGERIRIGFETQGIDQHWVIEPLMLLPFIENAFKHGIREEMNYGYVHIVVCLIDGELIVETKNSKALDNDIANNTGIGLDNVTKRLDMLYPARYTLNVTEDNSKYELRLTLKLRHD